ncbi:tetratricopeptide repeat protein [Thermospira aquatica]|uniref:Tetratricopeptide repeat protein n=1 Tax=Thermospira aquatica TaxID=2828656 RepID=A0AAX3BDM5_9SPIR|nr:tetratricopeptide repeat protein [Thermospira aquatica]URA10392.1 tetratricopeptide repeat protein [Thermospira aquatica]
MRKVYVLVFLGWGCLFWANQPPKTYLQALDAIASQNYTLAQSLLQQSLQDPLMPKEYQARAYNYLGDIALVNQSYQTAQKYYRRVLESYSDTAVYPRALYNMARMYVIMGDHEAGVALLSDYLNRYALEDANEDGALYWLGRAFSARGEYYRALGLYRELLKRFPSSAYAYHTRQLIQTIESSLQSTRTTESDLQKISADQTQYLKMLARLLELQNQLLDLKKQKIDELKALLGKEGL